MIYDIIYSLRILIGKLAFFNKQLKGFIIFLIVNFQLKVHTVRSVYIAGVWYSLEKRL